jgi:hypothetical protein
MLAEDPRSPLGECRDEWELILVGVLQIISGLTQVPYI